MMSVIVNPERTRRLSFCKTANCLTYLIENCLATLTSESSMECFDHILPTIPKSHLNLRTLFFQFPLKATLKFIAMIKRQAFFVLKSSYYNSWGNPYFLSKFLNTHLCTVRIMRYEPLPLDRINQYI